MANRVDTWAEAMKSAGASPPIDRIGTEAEITELISRNDAVLSFGEVRDRGVISAKPP